MPKANEAKKLVKNNTTKLTEGEKKKIKQANKAKTNPGKGASRLTPSVPVVLNVDP